jgi:release factor glutamine methyltransferase
MVIYQPAEDSFLLEKEVKKVAKNKIFLDMGSGSGLQAKAALSANAKSVLAADVNPEAVKHLKSQNIPAIKSNLFSNIRGKFDVIAFNPPYLPEDRREDKESRLTTTGGKSGDEIILKFLKQVPSHLNNKGIILLLLSTLTPKEKIIKLLAKQRLSCKVLSSQKLFFESLEVWEISNK